MKNEFLVLSLLLLVFKVYAQVNKEFLDPGFGNNGIVTTDIHEGDDQAFSMVLQPDGKILVAGTTSFSKYSCPADNDFFVARYNRDGSPDEAFGSAGIATFDFADGAEGCPGHDYGYALALQEDGKIVIGGWSLINRGLNGSEIVVMRLNSDGVLDQSFGSVMFPGVITIHIGILNSNAVCQALAVQEDGKILVAGSALLPEGNSDILLARLNTDGSPDQSFGNAGMVITDIDQTTDFAMDILWREDGRILVTGGSGTHILLASYKPDGGLDQTFGDAGVVLTAATTASDIGYDVVLQPDGKILVAGTVWSGQTCVGTPCYHQLGLLRYLPNGQLDTSFGTDDPAQDQAGVVKLRIGDSNRGHAVALQSNEKIIVAGSISIPVLGTPEGETEGNNEFALARFNADGSIDEALIANNLPRTQPGVLLTEISGGDDQAFSIAVDDEGKVIVAGFAKGTGYDIAVVRYLLESVTGIGEETKPCVLFPNPASDKMQLQYTLNADDIMSISLLDLNGRLIDTIVDKAVREQGDHRELIHMSDGLADGTYIIRIQSHGYTQSHLINKCSDYPSR